MTHFNQPSGNEWLLPGGRHEGFNQGPNENPFADLFRAFQGGHGPFEAAARAQHHQPHHHGGGAESAHHHLPGLSITGDDEHHHTGRRHHPEEGAERGHHHAEDGVRGHHPEEGAERGHHHAEGGVRGHHPAEHAARGHHPAEHAPSGDRQPDTGPGSWGPASSSSEAIASAAANSVGHHTYLPRHGSQFYGEHLPASLGCTSASTNMLFDGLKAAGKVSDRDYRHLHQISNDAAYASLQHQGIAKPVDGHALKPGDWAYFKNPGRKHGHSGVVFEGANGQLMVANNHSGTTIATPLSTMMHRYRSVRGLRADI